MTRKLEPTSTNQVNIRSIWPEFSLRNHLIFYLLVGAIPLALLQQGCASKGKRPYELDRAKRFKDDHPALVDFEDIKGWTVEANAGSAEISRSQEQLIWDNFTCSIKYTGDKTGAAFTIRPPEPLEIRNPFTAINMWVWNDYWKWEDDKDKPIAKLSILLQAPNGENFELPFCRDLDWPGWYLLHISLNTPQRRAFENGGKFKGIRLSNCMIEEQDSIFLDNLSFYREDLTPPKYDVLPRPGVDLAPGQDLGVHTGKERLAFPTTVKTILPDNISRDFATELVKDTDSYVFRYRGSDGVLEYRYKPERGNLGDVTAQWLDAASGMIRPMDQAGIQFKINDNVEGLIQERFGTYITKKAVTQPPTKAELIECGISGDTLVAKWKLSRDDQYAEVEYVFRLWQKSLVTDIHCLGGEVGSVSLGKVSNAQNPRLIDVPYLVGRPKVLLMGKPGKPVFMTSVVDHYRTGSSRLYFPNRKDIDKDGIFCGGGTHYIPKTNGQRNDCHERLFVTLSPRFEEVLPNIPNPAARWRDVAAEYLVCYYAVQDRDADYDHWKKIARYGMNKVIMLDWETCWRDKAESFTFRTEAAPAKGGDENLKEYIRKVQALGLRYALYNNYVDFAPVNALWDEDMLVRMPTGGWQQAWFRCYTPKPARAVKYSREMTKIMQDKFNPTAAGPDVHTAVSPWSRVDFDERMPGAGTMLTQYYSYGQILYEQQQIWNGPVYSECGNNYYYSGLTTGSGALDRRYNFEKQPWLVDFYLRKMQPISCHWSLGYGKTDESCDRFFAKTIAFAQPCGFLGGWRSQLNARMIRGYYLLQQLQSSYCKALIKNIYYADENGRLLDTSGAISSGAVNLCRIMLEYDNGLKVWINGHSEKNWQTPHAILPPAGFFARNKEGNMIVSSVLNNGYRADHVHSPAYDFVDGRGKWTQTPWAASDGQLIVLKKEDGTKEIIPFDAERFTVALDNEPAEMIALDMDRNEIGPASGRLKTNYYHITPVEGAVSYLLKFERDK